MSDSDRLVGEAKKMGRDVREQARAVNRQYQQAAESGFESVARSASEASEGFQAITAEWTEYSKKSLDDVMRAWEQLISARSLPELVEIQTRYAQKAFESYSSAMSRVGGLYVNLARSAVKPAEETARRLS